MQRYAVSNGIPASVDVFSNSVCKSIIKVSLSSTSAMTGLDFAVRLGSWPEIYGQFRRGGLDVLAQHIFGTACAGPFSATQIYDEVRKAHAYHALSRETFEQVLDFVSTGGYALRSYDRFARLRRDRENPDLYRLTHPRLATRYAMNVGTIVEAPMLKVRLTRARKASGAGRPRPLAGGRVLGEMEEYFLTSLAPGDTCAIPPDQLVSLAPSMSGEASLFRVINTDDAAGPTSDFHPLPPALG